MDWTSWPVAAMFVISVALIALGAILIVRRWNDHA